MPSFGSVGDALEARRSSRFGHPCTANSSSAIAGPPAWKSPTPCSTTLKCSTTAVAGTRNSDLFHSSNTNAHSTKKPPDTTETVKPNVQKITASTEPTAIPISAWFSALTPSTYLRCRDNSIPDMRLEVRDHRHNLSGSIPARETQICIDSLRCRPGTCCWPSGAPNLYRTEGAYLSSANLPSNGRKAIASILGAKT